jgi:hypothetical protein
MITELRSKAKSELQQAASSLIGEWDGEKTLTLRLDKTTSTLKLTAFAAGQEPDIAT